MSDLENQILNQVKVSIAKSIDSELTGYNKPLSKLTEKVIEKNSDELRKTIEESFLSVIRSDEFKDTILEEFKHKVSKILVSQLVGHVDQAVSKIKQDPTVKAKMIVAINNIINENAN